MCIYKEGRYAVNSGTFTIGKIVNTQQQNVRFEKHLVLLDGGISMLVQGLMTYQVESVETLIYQVRTPRVSALSCLWRLVFSILTRKETIRGVIFD